MNSKRPSSIFQTLADWVSWAHPIRFMPVFAIAALVCVSCGQPAKPTSSTAATQEGGKLRDVSVFAAVTDQKERSRALFLEASRVLLHPRCTNCHPDGDVPMQGRDRIFHQPPVTRGAEGKGVVGMECAGCHQDRNVEQARVPGAPNWHLAPLEMAWVGKTPQSICLQVKDLERNGGKSLAEIVEHSGHDKLVAWGWSPGSGREPAPGTQEQFGKLMSLEP